MKPSDLFLQFSHFFGYVLPGFIWVTAALLFFGSYPGDWTGWFPVASIILASCFVGLLMQDWLFTPIVRLRMRIKWLVPQNTPYAHQLYVATQEATRHLFANLPSGQMLHEYAESIVNDEFFLRHFCAKWVSERSHRAAEEVNEQEGAVKFLVGVIPAVVALGVGLVTYLTRYAVNKDISRAAGSLAACSIAAAWLFLFRLPKQIESQRDLELNLFLLLVLADSTRTAPDK